MATHSCAYLIFVSGVCVSVILLWLNYFTEGSWFFI
jgi:hypothetical protein